jgi:hypothetical protein
MTYSSQERAQFVTWFIESQYNYKDFKRRVQAERGAAAAVPAKNSVKEWKDRFLETGNLERKKVIRTR